MIAVIVPEANDKVVPETEPPWRELIVRFVIFPFVAAKFVVVTLVPVPFTKVKPCNEVPPNTVKVEVTVEDAAKKPPMSCKVWVVVAPRPVTVAKVSFASEPT